MEVSSHQVVHVVAGDQDGLSGHGDLGDLGGLGLSQLCNVALAQMSHDLVIDSADLEGL